MTTHEADRRRFLKSSTAATALTAASYSRVFGANERIGLGLIGYGLIAKTHVETFRKIADTEFVAVAECHRLRLAEGVKAAGNRAVPHEDFRTLLEEKSVDAVIVATPDHWHGLMTMMACERGKDVYVEKPLSLFVREGEWMNSIARRNKSVVQVGTQQRSGAHYLRARQLIRDGHIGQVVSVRMSSTRNIFPGFGKPKDVPAPEELNWNMWQGPAPERPYNTNRGLYHFRWFWDTSGGQMTNLGAHHLDIVDWVLGLDGLKCVSSVGGRYALEDNCETPDTQDALFDCGKFSATFTMREAARGDRSRYGLVFYGTHGSLGIDRGGFQVTTDPVLDPISQIPGIADGHPIGGPKASTALSQPSGGSNQSTGRTQSIEDLSGNSPSQYLAHAKNFIECIKTRESPLSDLASAQRTAIACHLANHSLRLGRSLRWDASAGSIIGDDDAQAMLVRPYRQPWDRELKSLGVNG